MLIIRPCSLCSWRSPLRTSAQKKFADAGQIYGRMSEAHGCVGRYRDHAVGAVAAAGCFGEAGDKQTSMFWNETAICVAKEHGFGMLESNTCVTLASTLVTLDRFDGKPPPLF